MIRIPVWLHDVLGETQRPADLVLIVAFGVGVTGAMVAFYPELFMAVPAWRALLATLLILDIAAGCIANLTSGTNDHYAARPASRWVFIAIHVHLPLVAFLLDLSISATLAIWALTIAGAVLVNLLHPGATQRVVAGTIFGIGACFTVISLAGAPLMACVALLFMLKVLVHFAVEHRADGR